MIGIFKWKDMKIIGNKNILGLAVEEKYILAADMQYDGEILHLKSTALLVLPDGVSFDKPAKVAELLLQFLRENKLTAKKVVIGLPAKWFMMRGKIVPPSTADSIAGMLKIHAEREFSMGSDELAIDYTGEIYKEKSSQLFLGAVRRKNLESVLEVVRTAGLSILSVTVSSMALRAMVCNHLNQTSPDYFLYIRPDFVEILMGENDQVFDVKHIHRNRVSGKNNFISELKRVISLYPGNSSKTEKKTMMIWDASNQDDQELLDIKNSLLPLVDIIDSDASHILKKMDIPSGADEYKNMIPASLGKAFHFKSPYYFDFYNSRMNAKIYKIKRSQIIWASVIILTLIVLVLNMLFTWQRDKRDVMDMRSRLEEMSEDTKAARDIIEKVSLARNWYSGRSDTLRCLREITLAFPVEGRVWATNLALNEEMKGIVSGKAVDEKSVIEVLDNLKDSILFFDVQMIYIRENGQVSQGVSFSMSFSFKSKGI